MIPGVRRKGLRTIATGLAWLVAAAAVPLRADEGVLAPARLTPSATHVLLLPAVDTEPWAANVLAQRQLVVSRRLHHDFAERGFVVLPESQATAAAATSPRLDLDSPSGRTPDLLAALAARTGADWVVSTNVAEVAEDASSSISQFHCHCRVLIRVWDARRHGWLENRSVVGHDHGGFSRPVWLFLESIDDAAQHSVSALLAPYPVVKQLPDPNP